MLNEGQAAPDFPLRAQDGRPVSLADLRGMTTVLVADLSGYTAVAEAYGTWVGKSMYGKRYRGVQRSTFVIGPDGKVVTVFEKVSPKTHDDVVLAALAESAAGIPQATDT